MVKGINAYWFWKKTKVIMMKLNLSGKRVLVAGASRGIGLEITRAFLGEGAKVCLVSREKNLLFRVKNQLARDFGQNVIAYECDCSSIDSLGILKKNISAIWEGIDIVIANVGDGSSVSDAIPANDQWESTWAQNFKPAINTARTFLTMLKSANGCLLFISSIAGVEAFGAPVDYSTAKSALIAFSKNIARKLAKEVRVNVIAPGNIMFPGGSWDKKYKDNPERVKSFIRDNVPMDRFGTPNEIADASLFLCSERAGFITGATLVIDGGQTVSIR